jgi:hypothetical protein
MPKIDGPTYSADVEWASEGKPVLYVTARGSVHTPKEAIAVIEMAVKVTNEGPFEHVCAVYNLLELTHVPMLARFITSGRISTTSRTAHIIIASHSAAIQLVGSLMAVSGAKRLRTMDVCKTPADIEAAVARWLALPDRAREYTIDNI